MHYNPVDFSIFILDVHDKIGLIASPLQQAPAGKSAPRIVAMSGAKRILSGERLGYGSRDKRSTQFRCGNRATPWLEGIKKAGCDQTFTKLFRIQD